LEANLPPVGVTLPWIARVRAACSLQSFKAFNRGQWIEPKKIASGLLLIE
jgi:hypothetical protein